MALDERDSSVRLGRCLVVLNRLLERKCEWAPTVVRYREAFDPITARRSLPSPPQRGLSAVDETAVKINGEWSWLYAAIDIGTKLILDVALFGRHGTDPAAAFLHGLREKHDLSEAEFLIDQFGYRTAIARLGLNGRANYTDRNLIGK